MSDQTDRPGWMAGPPPPPPRPTEAGPTVPRFPTGSPAAGPASAGSDKPRMMAVELKDGSPWVAGAAVVLVAFVLDWLADALLAFRHLPDETAQDRILTFFGVGSIIWAVALLLAASLLAAGRRFEVGATTPSLLRDLVTLGTTGAAAAVAVSAALDVLVELANFGHGIDQAASGLFAHLAVIPIAAGATWWAFRLRSPR